MGSACTFPVQSILFTCVAIAAVIHTDGGSVSYASVKSAAQEVQVYGDDIIVPMRSVDLVLGLLGDLGLKVNHTKTFYTGRFRESCGVDAFDGHDVTPSYAKAYPVVTRPESIESCVHSHNNFFRRGYERVATTIRRTVTSVRNYKFPEIPVDSGLLGWFSYDPDNSHLKSRWNTRIWLKEFRVDSFKTSQSLFIPEEDSVLLQYFTATKHRPDFLLGDRLGLGQRASRSLTRRWEGLPV